MLPIAVLIQSAPGPQENPLQQPMLPPVATTPWLSALEGKRGMLLLVGFAPGWYARLGDPFLQDVADELVVMYAPTRDLLLGRLGLQAPGAYLLNEFGKSLGGWTSGVPQDLRKAFEALGWRPLETEMKAFLRSHLERLDVRWRLVQKIWQRAQRRQTESEFEELGEALEDFLRQEGWAQMPSRALPALFPAKAERPVGALASLARNRVERIRDSLKRDPGAALAWEMLAFLSPWIEGSEPRIYSLLEDLEVPPVLFRALGAWPQELPIQLAEAQLRRVKDWAGLETFAASRRSRLEARFLQSTQDLPAPWAARFQDPVNVEPRLAFLQEAVRDIGRWQLLELEAQLEQGRLSAAGNTASLILRDGDRGIREAAKSLAKRFAAEPVLKALAD